MKLLNGKKTVDLKINKNMKYILIPIFRVITLPFLTAYLLLILIAYVIHCLWEWDFENFLQFEDISFKKDKDFFRKDNFWEEKYAYKTFLDYILNRKSKLR